MQQEVENFKKVNMISREQFDTLTPEPPVDPNQEVPPGLLCHVVPWPGSGPGGALLLPSLISHSEEQGPVLQHDF